jgi:hypothetical protein
MAENHSTKGRRKPAVVAKPSSSPPKLTPAHKPEHTPSISALASVTKTKKKKNVSFAASELSTGASIQHGLVSGSEADVETSDGPISRKDRKKVRRGAALSANDTAPSDPAPPSTTSASTPLIPAPPKADDSLSVPKKRKKAKANTEDANMDVIKSVSPDVLAVATPTPAELQAKKAATSVGRKKEKTLKGRGKKSGAKRDILGKEPR